MRRLVILAAALVLAVVGRSAVAQDGTPGPMTFEIAPGVTAEALAFVAGQEAPALYRLTFAPGVTYAVTPAPEIALAYGESGVLTITVDTPVTVARAGSTAEPGETVAAGSEFELAADDYVVLPPLAAGEVRNDGQEPATITVAGIVPSGGESAASPEAATPEA